MADDLTEAEGLVQVHEGMENGETGRILVRLLRQVRQLVGAVETARAAIVDLRRRVTDLENRLPPPGP